MNYLRFGLMLLLVGGLQEIPSQAQATTKLSSLPVTPRKISASHQLNKGVRNQAIVKFLSSFENRHFTTVHIPAFLQEVLLTGVKVKSCSPRAWDLSMTLQSRGGVFNKVVDFTVMKKDLRELRQVIRTRLKASKPAE